MRIDTCVFVQTRKSWYSIKNDHEYHRGKFDKFRNSWVRHVSKQNPFTVTFVLVRYQYVLSQTQWLINIGPPDDWSASERRREREPIVGQNAELNGDRKERNAQSPTHHRVYLSPYVRISFFFFLLFPLTFVYHYVIGAERRVCQCQEYRTRIWRVASKLSKLPSRIRAANDRWRLGVSRRGSTQWFDAVRVDSA